MLQKAESKENWIKIARNPKEEDPREGKEKYRERTEGWWRPDPLVECSISWNKVVSQFLDGEGEPGQITSTEESEKGTVEVERWGDENCNRCSSLFSSGLCVFQLFLVQMDGGLLGSSRAVNCCCNPCDCLNGGYFSSAPIWVSFLCAGLSIQGDTERVYTHVQNIRGTSCFCRIRLTRWKVQPLWASALKECRATQYRHSLLCND